MTVSTTKIQPETLRALLTELVDYAGLFPPAALDMTTAVREYAHHQRGPMAWMLGRFIVGASRLRALEDAFEALSLPRAATNEWRLSVLLGTNVDDDLHAVEEFNRRHQADTPTGGCIDTVEVKVQSPEEVESIAARVESLWARPTFAHSAVAVRAPAGKHGAPLSRMETYYEIPSTALGTDALESMIDTIRQRQGRAKIRTGGLTPESIPSPRSVAKFLTTCASLDVPFKATAGLHHPLRGPHSLSAAADEADERSSAGRGPLATMHGFVNVFMAAILARAGAEHRASPKMMSVDEIESIVLEPNAAAFHFDSHEAGWRHRTVSQQDVARHRSTFAIAFGSCSFDEPLEGLQALGWL